MACIFCDQTPETENAVEALTRIKNILQMEQTATPDQVKNAIEFIFSKAQTTENVLERERKRRREIEEVCEKYAAENRELQQHLQNAINRNPNPPTYRGPSSSPSRAGRGDDISWHNNCPDQAVPFYFEKPNGKSGRHAMPYGHTSKKDRVK